MLGRPDSGTSVDNVRLGAASNSMLPARSCESIPDRHRAGCLEKTEMFSRPDDSARLRSTEASAGGYPVCWRPA
jgi:hypothetical protein